MRQFVRRAGEGDLVVVGAGGRILCADVASPGRAARLAAVVVVAGAGVVGADALAAGPAQHLAHRRAVPLPGEVPQRDVHRRRRAHLGAARPEADVEGEQVAADRLDLAQVAAEQERRDRSWWCLEPPLG
jgi:hypothetical protein